MIIEHLPDGRTVGDTAALAAVTARPAATIRRHCTRTEHGYDVAACTAVLAERPDPVLLSAPDAHRYLGIPGGTVRSWASRGVLRALDRDGSGRPLYAADDLTHLSNTTPKG